MRKCQPNSLRWPSNCVSAKPRSARNTPVHAHGKRRLASSNTSWYVSQETAALPCSITRHPKGTARPREITDRRMRQLGILRLTAHKRRPRPEAHGFRTDQAHHPPGQGFAMAQGKPIGLLAQDAKQRIIQIRGVLHGFLLGKTLG